MQSPVLSPPAPRTVRYAVKSSDVLSHNRVNVAEEKSGRVIWYKERFLTDNEIVEHVVDNASSAVLWEIHRPLRGWYIRLRSPRFPRNVFIPLVPVPSSSPYHCPGSLEFSPGTSSHSSTDSDVTLTDTPSGQFSPTHTYPPVPTPPRATVPPPSPGAVHAKLDQLARPRAAISQFILLPHSNAAATPTSEGLFSRALRTIKNNTPASTNSFTLSPLPDGPPPTVGDTHHHHHHHSHQSRVPSGLAPLLTFEDTTPVFSVGSSTGIFEIHLDDIGKLGLNFAFWIAVALAYGEFLGDREGYLAAVAD